MFIWSEYFICIFTVIHSHYCKCIPTVKKKLAAAKDSLSISFCSVWSPYVERWTQPSQPRSAYAKRICKWPRKRSCLGRCLLDLIRLRNENRGEADGPFSFLNLPPVRWNANPVSGCHHPPCISGWLDARYECSVHTSLIVPSALQLSWCSLL